MAPRRFGSGLSRFAVTAGAASVAGLAWGFGYEVRSFRLRRVDVPVLSAGSDPLRVLHLSDLHLVPRQRRTVEWVRGLAALEPDLVVDTGDNLAHLGAVPTVLEALEPLLEFPGAFVLGSNDYFAPRAKNPAAYLGGPSKVFRTSTALPTDDLVDGLVAGGWRDLTNARTTLQVAGRRVDLVGVDDPHIGRDDHAAVSRPADPDADLTLGVTHAPYLRVLDAMTADGADVVLAGHTHGGQLCVPLYGALVTNCDLPTRCAKGLNPWSAGGRRTWLHVSAGLGTSPYARARFACPPEATLLTLVPRA